VIFKAVSEKVRLVNMKLIQHALITNISRQQRMNQRSKREKLKSNKDNLVNGKEKEMRLQRHHAQEPEFT